MAMREVAPVRGGFTLSDSPLETSTGVAPSSATAIDAAGSFAVGSTVTACVPSGTATTYS